MKSKISTIGAATFLATTIFGVAPASADVNPIVFPANANGTNNSGIQAIVCNNSVHMRLPVTQDTDPNAVVPGAGLYQDFTWYLEYQGREIGYATSELEYLNYEHYFNEDDLLFSAYLDDTELTGTETFSLEANVNYGQYTGDFELNLEVVDFEFTRGSGTKRNPYLVSNAEELSMMRCEKGKYFALTNDIDLQGVDWLPIGSFGSAWEGSLDGRGHTISNLSLEGMQSYVGLFGSIDSYAIRDLTLDNFKIVGDIKVGCLFGSARLGSLRNVNVLDSSVTAIQIGGLLGGYSEYSSAFSNIKVSGDVLGTSKIFADKEYDYDLGEDIDVYPSVPTSGLGGLLGTDEADGSNWSEIDADVKISFLEVERYEDDQNRPSYDYSGYFVHRIGGLVGRAAEGSSFQDVNVKSAITLPNVQDFFHTSIRIGGVFGESSKSFADNLSATSRISSEGFGQAQYVAGFTGWSYNTVLSRAKINTVIDLELGGPEVNLAAGRIAGVMGDGVDYGVHDVTANSKINIVRLGENYMYNIGGFTGLDDEGNITRVNSKSEITIEDADGTNNSLGIEIDPFDSLIQNIGGFVGDRDDRVSYTSISSIAKLNLPAKNVSRAGGFIGGADDYYGLSAQDLVVRGEVKVSPGSEGVAAFVGESGAVRLDNVLVSVKVTASDSPELIGTIFGYPSGDAIERSRFHKTFVNSGLRNPSDAEGVPNLGATAKQMKSAKFLTANDFDLVNVFKHKDGQWPTIRINSPSSASVIKLVKTGRSNKDTSISFGAVKQDGSRSFFVNLSNANARQTANLFVVRNGKKVKQIHSAALNGVGNWYTTSKFKLRVGDVLRIEINGVKVRALNL